MLLRKPVMADYQFVLECYADWPLTSHTGVITVDKVSQWIRRWIARDDEICLVAEDAEVPVGLILYAILPPSDPAVLPAAPDFVGADERVAKVYNIIVHPNHRQKGYHNQMATMTWERESKNGLDRAIFDTIPGPVRDKIVNNKSLGDANYKLKGTKQGETGELTIGELRK